MSVQLYSHSKQDLEKVVEIILNKIQNFQLTNTAKEAKPEDLISQKEASKFLKISLPTIIAWRNEKDLPHYNYNGRYYYSPTELLEYGRRNNHK
ncbi:helix-turn-helix domain-containing protein [Flavobacterium sp. TAB 87]|uniref:helix-turn-helix domain-containing protein n=1 Tax=Flavobacterium sp. TAB 87 TaxID=1729581 RepID=UPI00076D33EF|nr:helix-turn-helix domain-containing protein [Flavobacterium sp. TAB 87]KVV13405.1 Helix-turn-helix domain protein [Flavobacterium sp. TAB 87]